MDVGPSTPKSPTPEAVAPELSDLALESPGPRRLLHSLAYQAPLRFTRRVLEVGAEVSLACLADVAVAGRLAGSQVLQDDEGQARPVTAGRRIALYTHYAASGRISPMVLRQLASYQALDFDVVFVTNSERLESQSWEAVARYCWRVIRRRNVGLDFGGWRDSAARVVKGLPFPDELLLVNDSVLGPLRPLGPLLAHARSLKSGAVGLTESRQGGVHLQSYFILVLGAAATADTLNFLRQLRLSTAKWLLVQRGEFGLTRYLVRRGHRVSALFGYARTINAVLACAQERRYLMQAMPQFAQYSEAPETLKRLLLRWPVNPVAHLWRGLIQCLDFPFLKTELIRRNPGRLVGIGEWPTLMNDETAGLLNEHLTLSQ